MGGEGDEVQNIPPMGPREPQADWLGGNLLRRHHRCLSKTNVFRRSTGETCTNKVARRPSLQACIQIRKDFVKLLVNREMFNRFREMEIDENRTNIDLSDHSLITVKLKMNKRLGKKWKRGQKNIVGYRRGEVHRKRFV